ncbi:MAG: hypothetical protein Q8909_19295 [Bacteroidota bacterium]|nr:hypothetical protein [Bacteroidota bacterium]
MENGEIKKDIDLAAQLSKLTAIREAWERLLAKTIYPIRREAIRRTIAKIKVREAALAEQLNKKSETE